MSLEITLPSTSYNGGDSLTFGHLREDSEQSALQSPIKGEIGNAGLRLEEAPHLDKTGEALSPNQFAEAFLSFAGAREISELEKKDNNSFLKREGEGALDTKKEFLDLTPEEQALVRKLQARDAEVRAHEAAHLAAAGGLARGGINFTFTTGPDGKQYATGGEVKIDTSKGATPEETLQKARQIQAAALAPSSPSSADVQVAAQAAAMAVEAASELSSEGSTGSIEEREGAISGEPTSSINKEEFLGQLEIWPELSASSDQGIVGLIAGESNENDSGFSPRGDISLAPADSADFGASLLLVQAYGVDSSRENKGTSSFFELA